MKIRKSTLALLAFLCVGTGLNAQNVGIGVASPLERLHVSGAIRANSLAGATSRIVMADLNGTLVNLGAGTNGQVLTQTAGGPAWQNASGGANTALGFNTTGTFYVTDAAGTLTSAGNAWLVGGNSVGGNFGTTANANINIITNNLSRGVFTNVGEFIFGGAAPVLPGDMVIGVSNATYPWPMNGYSTHNGAGVYGAIRSGTTVYGGVQGETASTNATGAGVRGISATGSIGVSAQETSFFGWAVRADGDVGTTGDYWLISDARLKRNIAPINNALDVIMQLRGVTYDMNTELYPNYGLCPRPRIGFLAQEVEQVLPIAVTTKRIGTVNTQRGAEGPVETMEIKTVNYDAVIPVLVEAMQEQQQIIEQQNQRIQQLEGRLQQLEQNGNE